MTYPIHQMIRKKKFAWNFLEEGRSPNSSALAELLPAKKQEIECVLPALAGHRVRPRFADIGPSKFCTL